LIHAQLEDDSRKLHSFGNQIRLEATFRGKDGNEYSLKGVVGNDEFIITSLHFYDYEPESEVQINGELIKKGDF